MKKEGKPEREGSEFSKEQIETICVILIIKGR
ncbi:hypothetical protein SAMN06265218_101392 [Fodinibius sediminis]|uniref:Uncharacterized protein n=1 Tax=Fodinibius sediminis TaxID=1214077 RepID=A0A521AVA8_9BACT|nr:hypothetical protein SAMN06265218_101392 [Fodinibius sediminis]